MTVTHISAVTFAVRDMAQSVAFYKKLGFKLVHGGDQTTFSSLRFGEAFVNLATNPSYQPQWWGRAVFRVESANDYHRSLVEAGLEPDQPRNATWGERFFHVNDPDGHEISFAELLSPVG